MEYSGKLYGKVGGHYVPLHMTTDDVESLQKKVEYLESIPADQSLPPTGEDVQTPPAPVGMEEAQQFQNYIYESRRDFVYKVKQQEWDVNMRTEVDDLLICFDQMANRLSTASTPPAKDNNPTK